MQAIFNKLLMLKEELEDISNAINWAKQGIVNSKLLCKKDLTQILNDIENLPYGNDAQALNYATPSVAIKGEVILYIISLPITTNEIYNHLKIRPVTKNNKQILIPYLDILANKKEMYGIKENCLKVHEILICKQNQIIKLSKNSCISNLLNSMNANCTYIFNTKTSIEQETENLIFIDNYKGKLYDCENKTRTLNGTYVVQISNCSINLGNLNFITKEITNYVPLPSIFQGQLTESNIKLNIDQIHLENIKQIEEIKTISNQTFINNIVLYILIIIIVIIILAKKGKNQKEINVINEIPKPENIVLKTLPVKKFDERMFITLN
ncbi:uncharacterized protein LOC129951973 [Eupeodes corollae]|uniref:uncharacterized protein LOC129951973 n=1 Tax=Eupeodes corollae TaxID=290404 RepID=UPI002491ABDA|nr:uncharacterized protein LOC129951973 [Eupeodes corollae]